MKALKFRLSSSEKRFCDLLRQNRGHPFFCCVVFRQSCCLIPTELKQHCKAIGRKKNRIHLSTGESGFINTTELTHMTGGLPFLKTQKAENLFGRALHFWYFASIKNAWHNACCCSQTRNGLTGKGRLPGYITALYIKVWNRAAFFISRLVSKRTSRCMKS